MNNHHDIPIPSPLREALSEKPVDERQRLEWIWKQLQDDPQPIQPNVDDAWIDIVGRLETPSFAHRPTVKRQDRRPEKIERRPRPFAVAVAAALITLLVVAGLWQLYRPVVIEARMAEHETVQLPDGSVIELNSDSRLRIASRFERFWRSDRRRVELEGEAFFRVADDPRPFIVHTRDARLRVVGTEFNVRARDGSTEATTVTLVSGAIAVASRDGSVDPVTLTEAGSAAQVLSVARIVVEPAQERPPLDHVLAWRRRGFAFIDTPIREILDEVERRFGVSISPRTGVVLNERLNLFYSRGVQTDEILHDICIDQDCIYRPTNRGFALMHSDSAMP